MNKRFKISDIHNKFISTDKDTKNHMINVLRLKEGDKIVIFDGKGNEAEEIIREILKDKVIIERISEIIYKKPSYNLIVATALPKQQRLKFMLQKLSEIGVHQFIPLICSRSVVIIEKEKFENKKKRWEKIALNAARQALLSYMPEFKEPSHIKDLPEKVIGSLKIVAIPEKGEDIYRLLNSQTEKKNICICIGPEGGFTKEELTFLEEKEFIPVKLNLPVLRIETANIVLSSIILSYWLNK